MDEKKTPHKNNDDIGSGYPDYEGDYYPDMDEELAERNADMALISCTEPDKIPEPPAWLDEIPPPWEQGVSPVVAEIAARDPEVMAFLKEPPPPVKEIPVNQAALDALESLEKAQGEDKDLSGTRALMTPPVNIAEQPLPRLGGFCYRPAEEITATTVEWLWEGWLPLGSLAIMSAPPGVGKTTLAISLAAAVTRGGPFPDGTTCEKGGASHWSTEDNQYTVLKPHYEAERADITNVRYMSNCDTKSGLAPMCQNLRDQDTVLELIRLDARDRLARGLTPLRIVIIDNILNIMGGRDGNSNTDVRAALVKFSHLAAELNICILGIAHTSKDYKDKGLIQGVMGAQSFVGIARVLINVGKRYGETTGVIVRGKASNSSDYGGFEYTIEPCTTPGGINTTRIQWGEKKDGTAEELMKEYTSQPDPEQKDATEWLLDRLKFGPVDSAQIIEEAKAEGFSSYALRKARAQPGIACRQVGTKGVKGGCRSLLYRTDIAEAEETSPPVPETAVKQTVQNNSYLAAKEGYMQS